MIKFSAAALLRKCHRLVKGRDRVVLPWNDCLRCVAPIGIAASIDIGLSNWALEYITVSLYTMSKSTSIVFILVFAVLLALEKLVRCFLCLCNA
jgi:solute carrier family 35 protein C2